MVNHPRFHEWVIVFIRPLTLRSITRTGQSDSRGSVPVLISFPPMISHTTTVTLCGFAYGMKGFFLALAGSVLGATVAFVVLRFLFSKRLRKWSATNDKWTALETVVVGVDSGSVCVEVFTCDLILQETKGLPLVILIRLSPMPPWVYANTLFAVSPLFAVPTRFCLLIRVL